MATRTKCAGHHQHYGTDNIIRNNIYFDVDIGDVPTPGRQEIFMHGHCDSAIRASTHTRDVAACRPDTDPHTGCCCYPGCDQGKCSSFRFERNIVFEPQGANSTIVGTTFAHGLDNFSFTGNLYFAAGRPPLTPLFNSTGGNTATVKDAESFADWQRSGKDDKSLNGRDPLFTSNVTFALSPESPAIKQLGFVPIDLSTVGPRAAAGPPGAEEPVLVEGRPGEVKAATTTAIGRGVATPAAVAMQELVDAGLLRLRPAAAAPTRTPGKTDAPRGAR